MRLLLILFCFQFSSLLFSNPVIETADSQWIQDYTTRVPNFPKKNINFLWYADLMQNPSAFKKLIKDMAERYRDEGITKIVGLEARGFVFGVALAYELDLPFVMARKKGKLPRKTRAIKYGLEYGTDVMEIEEESLSHNDRVLIVDDILATGGTAHAALSLVEELGAEVAEVAVIFEIKNLEGRSNLPVQVFSSLALEE